ncbi:M14 family zinc carboxypeptidase [Conexibacter sp. SYSU D00693]|uniref:M14 family zinc carboxypeptidase n=1 Tax=Conexibacter sp. SYSU D00693 TaxID=2812560 RepID=UPI00196B6051|nr:M14 family zinc carboxypeptidase [Conexibacter sp. SYSU D00693]
MRRALPALLVALGLGVVAAPPAGAAPSLVRVDLDMGRADVATLERLGLDVTHDVRPRSADVVVHSAAERRRLRDAGFTFRERIADLGAFARAARRADAAKARQGGGSGLPSGRETYRASADFNATLDQLAAEHPGLVRPVVLPVPSLEGREIRGVEISQDVGRTDDGKPVFVVLAAHHAREWPSAEAALEFALDLVQRHDAGDARVRAILAAERVYVVPIINVDGYAVSRDGGSSVALRRKNCRPTAGDDGTPCAARVTTSGVDLNRNYAAYWGGEGASTSASAEDFRGSGPWSEPETQAVHELTRRLQVTGLQTLHNVAALVLRPPGLRSVGTAPDEPALKALGDAMAAATGYASQFGYELYDTSGTTEDWNYTAQGTFGYTIELGGDGFQGPFAQNVVQQYLGTPGTATEGKGVREALLLAAEQAADPRAHGVLEGRAPAGATLRLRKSFKTATSPVCSMTGVGPLDTGCLGAGPVQLLDDGLESAMTVPASGSFTWHVLPSTRPYEAAAGRTEAWTLECLRGGRVTASTQVVVARGERKAVAPCGPVASTTAVRGFSLAVDRARLATLVSKGPRVRVKCAAACRVTIVARVGTKTAARRTVALRAGSLRRTVRLKPAPVGRRLLRRSAGRTLRVEATATAPSATKVVVRRSLTLRR